MPQLSLNKCISRSKKQNKISFEGFFYKGRERERVPCVLSFKGLYWKNLQSIKGGA